MPTLLPLLALACRDDQGVHSVLSLCKGDPWVSEGRAAGAGEGGQGLFRCTGPTSSSASRGIPGIPPSLFWSIYQAAEHKKYRAASSSQPRTMSSGAGSPWRPFTCVSLGCISRPPRETSSLLTRCGCHWMELVCAGAGGAEGLQRFPHSPFPVREQRVGLWHGLAAAEVPSSHPSLP